MASGRRSSPVFGTSDSILLALVAMAAWSILMPKEDLSNSSTGMAFGYGCLLVDAQAIGPGEKSWSRSVLTDGGSSPVNGVRASTSAGDRDLGSHLEAEGPADSAGDLGSPGWSGATGSDLDGDEAGKGGRSLAGDSGAGVAQGKDVTVAAAAAAEATTDTIDARSTGAGSGSASAASAHSASGMEASGETPADGNLDSRSAQAASGGGISRADGANGLDGGDKSAGADERENVGAQGVDSGPGTERLSGSDAKHERAQVDAQRLASGPGTLQPSGSDGGEGMEIGDGRVESTTGSNLKKSDNTVNTPAVAMGRPALSAESDSDAAELAVTDASTFVEKGGASSVPATTGPESVPAATTGPSSVPAATTGPSSVRATTTQSSTPRPMVGGHVASAGPSGEDGTVQGTRKGTTTQLTGDGDVPTRAVVTGEAPHHGLDGDGGASGRVSAGRQQVVALPKPADEVSARPQHGSGTSGTEPGELPDMIMHQRRMPLPRRVAPVPTPTLATTNTLMHQRRVPVPPSVAPVPPRSLHVSESLPSESVPTAPPPSNFPPVATPSRPSTPFRITAVSSSPQSSPLSQIRNGGGPIFTAAPMEKADQSGGVSLSGSRGIYGSIVLLSSFVIAQVMFIMDGSFYT
ncbi:hypothetical protein CBR_g57730 [Chara braunii]|uniref:Uncharacterized protein n=1 Tax=Chara braunii TaxID=69332 RepID=A0A388MED8_CHABU|nr:hypothetical protein CBR_g57730 [Chara braunii]|eukprot:GBG92911.1 hypothetical protein CBR_g57730 [Chara braunii]